jgi:RNA polymerase sigma-70 factor (ECF subfamily)
MDEPTQEKRVQAQAMKATNATNPAGGADLEKIFREHRKQILNAAYRVTGNSQDAEDVLQTVFLRLARREGGSPLSDSLGGYLQRAAVNASLDVLRSRKSARATALDDVEPLLEGKGPGPDAEQQRHEVRALVREALTKVSENAAEIFVLRYFEGYGNHEIAKMLGTSRSTVNVILHRTRNRLKDEMRDVYGDAS